MAGRLLTGATVWAGPACTPGRAWVLVEDGQVAAVGGDGEEPPPADHVVDLTGCHVLPGFVDVHLHLTQAAWFPRGGDAFGWRGLADALHAVRAAAAADPQPPWLLFWNAARWQWPEGRLPTIAELDEAAPGRRVLVSTLDMHRGAASSEALAALGLPGRGQAGDLGSDITRDRRGRPTGELWEEAYGIALQRALADTMAYAADAGAAAVLQAEAGRCLAAGISHAHDPYVSPDWHPRMAALHARGPLRLSWATGSPAGMHSRPPGPAEAPDGPYGDAAREVKLFADGGDRCAIALPPRALAGLLGGAFGESWRLRAVGPLREALRRKLVVRPRQVHTPYLRYTDAELASLVSGYAGAGVRLRIHALGNLAGRQAARALQRAGVPPGVATIDHLLLLDRATADQVAAAGASVSYQPGFIPRYGQMLTRMRVDRYATVLGGRLLLRAGVPLALSSDYPPGPLDPLHNLRAAVTRQGHRGRQLQPGQALTREQAVRALTVTAAASLHAPGSGGIAPGQPADLAICDGDPFEPGTQVTQTWVNGQVAWPPRTGPVSGPRPRPGGHRRPSG
jgi:predicted amidohydrolase YtcJ